MKTIVYAIILMAIMAFALKAMTDIPVVAFDYKDKDDCVYIEHKGIYYPCFGKRLPIKYHHKLVDGYDVSVKLCKRGNYAFCNYWPFNSQHQ